MPMITPFRNSPRTYERFLSERRENARVNAKTGQQFIRAWDFAVSPSQDALVALIEGSLGRDAANEYRLYLERRIAHASWLDVRRYNEPILFTGQTALVQPIGTKAGGTAKTPAVQIEAYNGGPMSIAGFNVPVLVDVLGIVDYGRPIPILRDHDSKRVVGHGKAFAESNTIRLTGVLSVDNKDSKEIIDSARKGFPWQASIGCQPIQVQPLEEYESAHVNGATRYGPLLIVREGQLKEVSVVSLGADQSAKTHVSEVDAEQMAGEPISAEAKRSGELPRHKRELSGRSLEVAAN